MSAAKAIRVLFVAAAVVFAGVLLVRLNRVALPDGPVDVVWDHEVCAHCKMHIGDPRFAAQLQDATGRVLNFDDPGCLVEYLEGHSTDLHASYVRDHEGNRWLSASEAGFLPVEDSPMGYGVRAVDRNTPGANDWAWARAQALARKQREQ